MGLFGKSSTKPPEVIPLPPAATPPTAADATLSMAANNNAARARRSSGMGFGGTIKTSPQGVAATPVARTSLLGGA